MIDLDSPQWAELQTAYGTASEVPAMLEELYAGRAEPLDDLFSYICHQGSIYTGSVAALPHLLKIAQAVQIEDLPEFKVDVLTLAGAICESAEFTPEFYTPYIKKAFFEEALVLTLATLREFSNSSCALYLLKAAAAFAGHPGLARVLDGFADEEFSTSCPTCKVDLYIWPALHGLTVAAEDPVVFPDTERLPVVAGEPAESTYHEAYQWVVQVLGKIPNQLSLKEGVKALFGKATCPACKHEFLLLDTLMNDSLA